MYILLAEVPSGACGLALYSPDQRCGATVYALVTAWHAVCDSHPCERLSAVRSASTEGHRDAHIYWRGRPATARPPAACRLGGTGIRPRGGNSRPGPRDD